MLSPLEVLRLYPPHDGTIASMLRSRVAVAGEREFIVYQGRSWSYAQVLDEVGRTAAVLGTGWPNSKLREDASVRAVAVDLQAMTA